MKGAESPESTQFKVRRTSTSDYYYAGVAYNPGKIIVYGTSEGSSELRQFTEGGMATGSGSFPTDEQKNSLISQLQQYCSIGEIEVILSPVAVAQYLPDWDSMLELQAL